MDIPAPMEAGPSTSALSPAVQNAEMYFLTEENRKLKEQLKNARFSFKDISQEDNLVFKYTGLPTADHFLMLCELISRFELNYYNGWKVEILTREDQLLCTLMGLRLDFPFFDLGLG